MKKIAELTFTAITYKPKQDYVFNDLYGPVKKKMIEMGQLDQNFQKEINEIYKIFEIKKDYLNFLSHDNPDITGIFIEDLQIIFDIIKRLNKLMLCNCGKYLIYDIKSKILICSKPCKSPTYYGEKLHQEVKEA